jgi:branched-subunit amino acid aminotransferase/4-amino-4-deoxychorismate lyase
MPETCLVNGRIRSAERASIPVDDWAVRYGWGLFETIRIHKGCPLFLERHLDRLCRTALILELGEDSADDRMVWRRDIIRGITQSRMSEGIVNCYWTRGSVLARIAPSRIVRIRPRPRYPKGSLSLWVAPWRIEPTYPGSGVKTLAYFPYIFAGLAARREGCDEALVLNTSNRVADGAASSIFVVRNGQVLTPSLDQGTLPGITRSVVLEILDSLRVRHREGPISWKTLVSADEIFLTSSLRGVMSVKRVFAVWKSRRVDKSVAAKVIAGYADAAQRDIRYYRTAY